MAGTIRFPVDVVRFVVRNVEAETMTRRISWMVAAVLVALVLGDSHADGQPAGAQAPPGRRYSHNPFAQSVYWLGTPQIAQEIELVPEQKTKIAKIRTEMSA